MSHKLLLPILALTLAMVVCQIQFATPTQAPATVPIPSNTPVPPAPTDTPVPPTPTALSGLTLDMLRNGTYNAPAFGKTVKLVNGAYSGADSYSVLMLDTVAFGDLNGDGVVDAAILLVESGGGSGAFVSLIPVLNLAGAPSQAGQVQLGDRVQVTAMKIASSAVSLDMVVPGPNDPLCCPSQPETQTYQMIGNTFWMTHVTSTTPDNHERSITINTPAQNADVTNPFTISGSVTIAPFENTLAYRVYLPDGTKVNESPQDVDSGGIMGGPGTFTRQVDLGNAGITGPVIFQFLDLSAADGSIMAMGSVVLNVH